MTSGRLSFILILFAGIASFVLGNDCAADLQVRDFEVGIAGQYKLGRWTPVRFTLQAAEQPWRGSIRISARDGDDAWATYTGGGLDSISLAPGASDEIETYVRIGRQNSSLRVEAMPSDSAGERLTQFIPLPPALLASQHAILVVGGDIGLRPAIRIIPRQQGEEIIGTTIEDVSQLPSQWYGYESFDLLVLTTADDSLYDNLSESQQAAINDWVALGGRLIITMGANGKEYLEQPTLISQFAPGAFQRTVPLHQVSALENYSEATMSLDEGETPAARLPPLATQLANVQGEVLLSQGRDVPLIIRTAYGLGQVIFVALDLDTAPIADWKDRNRLVAKLFELGFSETPARDSQQNQGEAAHLGFDDLSGQVTSALQVFEGVTLLNFSTVAALIVVYVLLIGPIDFWLVRVVLKRPELTWITSATLVLAFCALAWWLAGRTRGDTPRQNQIDIVDIDVAQHRVRGTSWLHLYSPTSRSFDLALKPQRVPIDASAAPHVLLSWQGAPGTALGGMNRESRIDHGGAEYLLPNSSAAAEPADLSIRSLSLPAAGAKALAARWWAKTEPLEEFDLREVQGKKLVGYFDNPLAVPLTNCWLYHDRWAYQLGNLDPGQRVELTAKDSPRDSEWALTERRVVATNDAASPWDQSMRDDVPKIVRMMMFHEVAQGRNHTELLHRQYGYVDLSHHLRLDRAILVGMAEEPATQVTSDGKPLEFSGDKRWTFYRIVYPTIPLE